MDEQSNDAEGPGDEPMVPSPSPAPPARAETQSQEGRGEEDEEEVKNEDDELIARAHKLMERITASSDNPNPTFLHALATLLETLESRFVFIVVLICFEFVTLW